MKTKLQALTLAGALAVTVLTGGAAIAGLTHTSTAGTVATPVVAQAAPAPAAPSVPFEEGGD